MATRIFNMPVGGVSLVESSEVDLRSLLGLGGKVKREETFCQHLMACKEPEAFLVEDARQHWRWDCKFAVQVRGSSYPVEGCATSIGCPPTRSCVFPCPAPAGRDDNLGMMTLLHTKGRTAFQRLTPAACPQGRTADWGGHTRMHPAVKLLGSIKGHGDKHA